LKRNAYGCKYRRKRKWKRRRKTIEDEQKEGKEKEIQNKVK
jgi:hypothetical protein